MREHLKDCLRNYFIIVTLINVLMFIMGSIFQPEQQFGYEVFLYPLIYAALGSIPGILIREKKEPTVKEFLIHQFIGVVMTSAIIIAVMFFGVKMTKEHMVIAAVNVVGVFVIYVLVNVITWILDSKKAESMTNDLKAFQEKMMKG